MLPNDTHTYGTSQTCPTCLFTVKWRLDSTEGEAQHTIRYTRAAIRTAHYWHTICIIYILRMEGMSSWCILSMRILLQDDELY